VSQTWAERNEAWEGRAKALGERAVLHVGHKTVEQQIAIFQKQEAAILPIFEIAIANDRPKFTLDFGCGVGRWTEILARITGGIVEAIDPTQQFLEIAESHRKSPSVTYTAYHDGVIPFPGESMDAVWACMVLSTILDVSGGMFEHTVSELRRVLRPGGLMFLVDNTSGPPHRPVVRSPYSISRTVEEYSRAFNWCGLRAVGEYEDLGEINTIFIGRKR
jgi:ubiquinone/menaquinone biosynthesis C-methylase UbiE